jgi:hypothetical protein
MKYSQSVATKICSCHIVNPTLGGRRIYTRPNKKKIYPDGTIFCLRYSMNGKRKWQTLTADNLTAALIARAIKESALLTNVSTAASAPTKPINVDGAMAT